MFEKKCEKQKENKLAENRPTKDKKLMTRTIVSPSLLKFSKYGGFIEIVRYQDSLLEWGKLG